MTTMDKSICLPKSIRAEIAASDRLVEDICTALADQAVEHEMHYYVADLSPCAEQMTLAAGLLTREGAVYLVEDCRRRNWLILRPRREGIGDIEPLAAIDALSRQLHASMQVLAGREKAVRSFLRHGGLQ